VTKYRKRYGKRLILSYGFEFDFETKAFIKNIIERPLPPPPPELHKNLRCHAKSEF
jgi:hypothetical protein